MLSPSTFTVRYSTCEVIVGSFPQAVGTSNPKTLAASPIVARNTSRLPDGPMNDDLHSNPNSGATGADGHRGRLMKPRARQYPCSLVKRHRHWRPKVRRW